MAWWDEPSVRAWAIAIGCLLSILVFLKLTVKYGASKKLNNEEREARNSLLTLFEGADGALSTSKFQWLVWNVIVLVCFIAIYATSKTRGVENPSGNVFLVIGISSTTMVAAKAIKINQAKGRPATVMPRKDQKGGLVMDDDGYLDLSKTQLVAWTLVGAGIFVWETFTAVTNRTGALPDISISLITLMGLGHAAYLAKKVAETEKPSAIRVNVADTDPGPDQTDTQIAGHPTALAARTDAAVKGPRKPT